ncbi:UvrB/UvrC motif-containing protein [Patescibacteria group bacterium]|nr:UvrB/UvrC motif-containing protein [Patescibacteria group bacterium]
MEKLTIQNINKLPDKPGVYLFKKDKVILYIGKATSLRDRVKSYFNDDLIVSRGPKIVKMMEEINEIDWQETDSVLEALILEASLIKKHLPSANTLGKDNKSYNHIIITEEEYPRVILVREHNLKHSEELGFDIKYQFGPFPYSFQLKEALKIIRKIFPFRGEKDLIHKKQKRKSALNIEIGLSPDFSVVSKSDYAKNIRNIKMFLEGKKASLVKKLEKEMHTFAKKKEFEKANKIKKQIFALSHIQDIALIKEQNISNTKRIESYDIAHMSEKNKVGVMTVIEGGMIKKSEYRKFNIKRQGGGDIGALREVLERRLKHDEWQLPKIIVIDGGLAQKNVAEKVLTNLGFMIPVIAVVKDEHHRPKKFLGKSDIIADNERDILIANSEAHRFAIKFHKQKRSKAFLRN